MLRLASLVAGVLVLVPAAAHIAFTFIPPQCNPLLPAGQQGCLRGQLCLDDHTCEMNWGPQQQDKLHEALDESTKISDVPHQQVTPTSTTALTEPVLGSPISTADSSPTGAVTTNGQCGATNNNTACGDWHLGSCCSMNGYCGNTTAHCGEGCQSGPCQSAPVAPAPSAKPAPAKSNSGSFKVVGQSGVPAMHAALMPNGRVVFLDKIENYTQLKLPNGQLAYSAEYDPATNQVVGLAYKTKAFCAGGSFLENGTLLSVGGNVPLTWLDPTVGDGFRGLRYLTRSSTSHAYDSQSWAEPGNQLNTARWYPTVQTLADGTVFVASGSLNGLDTAVGANNNPTYEVLNRQGISHGGSIPLPLLVRVQPYCMYPFVHLLPNGELFIFSAKSSEVFSLLDNASRKSLPDLPGEYRTYPNTGGSVLLPLSSAKDWTADVLVCGGGAYQDITSPTDPSCGRIQPLVGGAQWEMDAMPEDRGMIEGTLLPDGTVLWLNGASSGAQGYGLARAPTLEALIYNPDAPLGTRWTRDASSEIPRLYHSVALLLLDGSVMIAGSNPSEMPVLAASDNSPFPTEFRVEIYTPPYLSGDRANARPADVTLSQQDISAAGTFEINFNCRSSGKALKVALYHGGFVTHSLHMGHRMLYLDTTGFQPGTEGKQRVSVLMPGSPALAPPGPYVLYLVVDGVPSVGQFLNVKTGVAEQNVVQEGSPILSPSTDSTTTAPVTGHGSSRVTPEPQAQQIEGSGTSSIIGRDQPTQMISVVPIAPHTEWSETALQLLRSGSTESAATARHVSAPEPILPHTENTERSLALARGEPTPDPMALRTEGTEVSVALAQTVNALPSAYDPVSFGPYSARIQVSPGVIGGEPTPVPRHTPQPMAPHTERTAISLALARGEPTPEPMVPHTAGSQYSPGGDNDDPTPVSCQSPEPMALHTERTALSLALKRSAHSQTHGDRPKHLPIQPSSVSGTTPTTETPESCQDLGRCRKTPVPQSPVAARTLSTGATPHTGLTMTSLATPDWHGNNLIEQTVTEPSISSVPTSLAMATDKPRHSNASDSSGGNTPRDAEPSFASPSACGLPDLGCSVGGNEPGITAQTLEMSASSISNLLTSTVQTPTTGESNAVETAARSWTTAGGSNPVVTNAPPEPASAAAEVSGGEGNAAEYGTFLTAIAVGFVVGVVLI